MSQLHVYPVFEDVIQIETVPCRLLVTISITHQESFKPNIRYLERRLLGHCLVLRVIPVRNAETQSHMGTRSSILLTMTLRKSV